MSLQAWIAEEKWFGRVAAQADLCWDFSIVCLYVCSTLCQAAAAAAAAEMEARAEPLPHKGHSLSAPGSGLLFNCRQTASCMCGKNNSISSVGFNRQLFVAGLSVCLSQTQPTHVWQWSNICGACGTSYSKQWKVLLSDQYISVLRDENDDKWVRGLESNGSLSHGSARYFLQGWRHRCSSPFHLLAFQIS